MESQKNHLSSGHSKKDLDMTIKINKDSLVNSLLVLLIVLGGAQLWQVTSLRDKVATAQELGNNKSSVVEVAQPVTPSSGGGLNNLPSQVGGC